MRQPLFTPSGNYEKLLDYQKSVVIYDITFFFCNRFLAKGDRTIDQMVQAARSGKQNIVEGCAASSTNKETEIKLINVAKASLQELLKDYQDFLRTRGHAQWAEGSDEFEAMRALGREHGDSAFFMKLVQNRPPETIANIAIILINQADYLLFRHLTRLGDDFARQGDLHERLKKAREEELKDQRFGNTKIPLCPKCGREMARGYADAGPLRGQTVWVCSDRNSCTGGRDLKTKRPLPEGSLLLGFPWERARAAKAAAEAAQAALAAPIIDKVFKVSSDPKDPTAPKDPKDPTAPKDPKDPTDPKAPIAPKDPKDPTDPKTTVGTIASTKPKDATPQAPLVVILANGAHPRHATPRELVQKAALVIACDGASLNAERLGRPADFIIGDGDSTPDAEKISFGPRFIRVQEQSTNDLCKAFRFVKFLLGSDIEDDLQKLCILSHPPLLAFRQTLKVFKVLSDPKPPNTPRALPSVRLAILGATGLREDHTIGNIFHLPDFAADIPDTTIYTDAGTFVAVLDARTFACRPNDAVSVFAPQPGTHATSTGLHWPLDGVDLAPLWAGTLNRTTGEQFTIHTDLPLLIYRPYPPPPPRQF